MRNQILKTTGLASLLALLMWGCGGGKASISVMPSLDEFQQHTNADVKIDILFVIDDSGSMRPVQENLRNNFQNFINDFYSKGFDFRIAVAKSSAYGTETNPQTQSGNTYYEAGRTVAEFRCGAGNNCGTGGRPSTWMRGCTGQYGDTPTTNGNGNISASTDHILSSTNLSHSEMVTKFKRNSDVGLCGDGSERGIESAETVLRNMKSIYSGEQQFPRHGAHMAVIHVGDEPDGRWSTEISSSNSNGSLNSHSLSGIFKASSSGNLPENIQAVHSFLDALEAHEPSATVSVHAIQHVSENTSCRPNTYIGYPQMYMAEQADGMIINVCSNFAGPLVQLSDHISSLASSFELGQQLDAAGDNTLEVYVEGINGNKPLPRNTSNGFQYDINTNKITFYGNMIPPQGALIGVTYTCSTLTCD